ncbi:MAG TPA: nucleoside/nucleotide kinase family protein [Pseudonocardia sp.]|jgi:pantothenate kinase|nr:nucleoside/nucleotide kinase family protein [Pseudonocardia sp.]
MSDQRPAVPMTVDQLVLRVAALAAAPRVLVGITGEPGAGKSTCAARLRDGLADRGIGAALVGMDGFHIAHRALGELGLVEVKGAPETFDAGGYLALLHRLRARENGVVWAPEFRREIEDSIASAIPVGPEVRVVITEGNYLLLDGPWRGVRSVLDEVWFLEVSTEVRHRRLAARHEQFGRSAAQAWERTLGSDERNARTISETRHRADLVVCLSG